MKTQRITDQQATALLQGRVPEGREDLEPLTATIAALRLTRLDPPPQPSAALAARLDLDRLAWRSVQGVGAVLPPCDEAMTEPAARRGIRKRTAFGWFAGLGLAAQLVIGAGAVTASAAGLGMAGALPPAAQEFFDDTIAETGELLGLTPKSGDTEPPLATEVVDADVADSGESDAPTTGETEAVSDGTGEKPAGVEEVVNDARERGNGNGNGPGGPHGKSESARENAGNGNRNGNSDSARENAGTGDGNRDARNENAGKSPGGDSGSRPVTPGGQPAPSKDTSPGDAPAAGTPAKEKPADGAAGGDPVPQPADPAKAPPQDPSASIPGSGDGGHGQGGSKGGRP